MTRTRAMVAGVALGLVTALACTPPYDPVCPNGVLPWDGQSDVPVDTRIVFRVDVDDAIPSLDDAIVLRDAAGRRVPLRFEVDGDRGQIVAAPRAPLRSDTRYELHGIDWSSLEEGGHWWRTGEERDFVVTTFTTGSAPAALDAVTLGDGVSFVLLFSEPVDVDTVRDRLVGVAEATYGTSGSSGATTGQAPTTPVDTGDPGAAPVFEVIGLHDGEPNLVEVLLVAGTFGAGTLTVGDGVETPAGVTAPEASLWLDLAVDESDELVRLDGEPYCITRVAY